MEQQAEWVALENSDLKGMSFPSHTPESLGIYMEDEEERFSQPEMVSDSKEMVIYILNRADHVWTHRTSDNMHKTSTDSNQTKS